jgi:hypothetical protein
MAKTPYAWDDDIPGRPNIDQGGADSGGGSNAGGGNTGNTGGNGGSTGGNDNGGTGGDTGGSAGGDTGGGDEGSTSNPSLISVDLNEPLDGGLDVGDGGLDLPDLPVIGDNPVAFVDLNGPADGEVQVGSGDPDDALVTLNADGSDLGLPGDLGLPDISGVGDDLGPLAVADLNGPADGDVQIGSGDPDDALVTLNADGSDLGLPDISGVGDDLGPLAVADLNGPADGDVQVGSGDPNDALVTVNADGSDLGVPGDLGLPDISGVGDDLGPLAVADLNGPAEGDVQVGEGDPADAFITANFDTGDVGVGDGLASLPVDVGGLGDLGGLGDALDVDLPV